MDIQVTGLGKTYKVPEKEEGLAGSLCSLFRRKFRYVPAVADLSFAIAPGEAVGFLGPNGAGKTTTMKMLSGLLWPTGGEAVVLGFTPWQRKKEYLMQIGFVMGNRSQLWWDIPARDSFVLNREVYKINPAEFRNSLEELADMLDVGNLLSVPVRNLSLGERMKMELIGALLHRPRVLFLDEPTLGLDVVAQQKLRGFLADYRAKYGVTMLVTSHYMADIAYLCPRVLVIDQGRLTWDGPLTDLGSNLERKKLVEVVFVRPEAADRVEEQYSSLIRRRDGGRLVLAVAREEVAMVLSQLTPLAPADLSVQDPSLDETLAAVFKGVG